MPELSKGANEIYGEDAYKYVHGYGSTDQQVDLVH